MGSKLGGRLWGATGFDSIGLAIGGGGEKWGGSCDERQKRADGARDRSSRGMTPDLTATWRGGGRIKGLHMERLGGGGIHQAAK